MRGFGALHLGIALATLRAAVRNESCRDFAALNLACALGDTAATSEASRRRWRAADAARQEDTPLALRTSRAG